MDLISALLVILQLIFLEGLLSIDNAAVLAALTFHLPAKIAPPRPLNHRLLKKIIGSDQRSSALKVGILGAYLGRGIMLVLASTIIQYPILKIIGAFYLIYLTIEHFHNQKKAKVGKISGKGFWSTVLAIELADLAFSLDNVVAAISLSSEIWVVIIGVFIGIAVMRFGATLMMHIMEREPELADGAYLVVFAIAIELITQQVFQIETPYTIKFLISIGILLLTVLVSKIKKSRRSSKR